MCIRDSFNFKKKKKGAESPGPCPAYLDAALTASAAAGVTAAAFLVGSGLKLSFNLSDEVKCG